MNSFELNKIAAALLVSLLFVVSVNMVADSIFHKEPLEANSYVTEGMSATAVEEVAEVVVVEGPSLATLLAGADADRGAKGFGKCSTCHTDDEGGSNRVGPNLWGVVDRAVAGVDGYNYSDALVNHGGVWDFALLDDYLARPRTSIPGNKMSFPGLRKDGERADMILYLRSLSTAPVPLPVEEKVPEPIEEIAEEVVEDVLEPTQEDSNGLAEAVAVSPDAMADEVGEETETVTDIGVDVVTDTVEEGIDVADETADVEPMAAGAAATEDAGSDVPENDDR